MDKFSIAESEAETKSVDVPIRGSSSSKQVIASLLSGLWPGSGHLLLGQPAKGMVLTALFVIVLSCFWPLRVLRYYAGFMTLVTGWPILSLYSSCSATLIRRNGASRSVSRRWLLLVIPFSLFVFALAFQVVSRASGFRIFNVPSTAMEPTIQMNDQIMTDFHAYRNHDPQYRDVVVFRHAGIFAIKRIIAMGGDTIEGRSGRVIVNGNEINESYIQHSRGVSEPQYVENDWQQDFGPATLLPGQYFVIGDNRDVSLDSRSPEFGPINRDLVDGRVLYVYRSPREGARIR